MKKIAILMIICVLCSGLLIACNGGNSTADVKKITFGNAKDFSTNATADGDVVTTEMGLTYTCGGFDGKDFHVDKNGLEIELTPSGAFNKYSLYYTSTEPLKVVVYYGSDCKETVYLEAQTGKFSSLIDGYLEGTMAEGLCKIVAYPCKESAEFLLCDLVCEQIEVYDDDVYYLENGRYKLGVYLAQGGGLCYLSDSQATFPMNCGINLLNNYDAGRLIQQSYYGSSDNESYTSGEFNNSHWCYNPVQGGDQFGNMSKIVDLKITDSSLYVKCQPQDWSLDGQITPSYMENVYTVYEDRIVADCRFVDFSGYEHTYRSQELPAFYSISYLDVFTYYGGQNPWSGDNLTVKENLDFWGDPEIAPSCTFAMGKNTETWCAWTKGAEGYGLGLYTPNITTLYAGRFKTEKHSLNCKDSSCSYVAPLASYQHVSYLPFEYSYMLTTGKVSDIRSTFTTYKDFATNSILDR